MMKTLYSLFPGFSCFLLFLSAIFISGCEYHTDKEYFSDAKMPDHVNVSVVLNPSVSVYNISDEMSFNGYAIADSLKCFGMQVFVDETQVYMQANNYFYFSLKAADFTDGYHKLTVVITTNSGSHSLADLLGTEGFNSAFSWDLFIDKMPLSGVQITRIFNDKGLLKLEWEKFDKANFGRYEVLQTVTDQFGGHLTTKLDGITDPNRNYFYDSAYVGGDVEYTVNLITKLSHIITSQPKPVSAKYSMRSEWLNSDLVNLTWNACPYYQAFREYRIFQNDELVFSSSDTTRISFSGNIGIIGITNNFKLEILSKKDDQTGQVFASSDLSIGIPIPKYIGFLNNNVNEFVYLTTYNKLYRFNTNTRKVVDSITNPYQTPRCIVSPNDNLLIDFATSRKMNPPDLSVWQPILINSSVLNSLSNDDLGLDNSMSGMRLIDFNKSEVVSVFPGLNWGNLFYITENSKYFISADGGILTCYQIVNDQPIKKWEHPGYIWNYVFIPGESDKIMLINNGVCEIRMIENLEMVNSFSTDSYYIGGFDPANKTVMLCNATTAKKVMIYNYQTGQKLKEIKADFANPVNYFRGSIYSSNGYEIPLNLKK